MKKKICLLIGIICVSVLFLSCQTEVTLLLNKNGSVDVRFTGGAGKVFTQMILAATDGEDAVFDTAEISYQLGVAGFSNVSAVTKGTADLSISMSDGKRSSYLFSSGICSVKDSKLNINLDSEKLQKFYDSSNEMVQQVLDLLLAPVFNDEVMEENEYLEVVGSFYGASAAEELQFSDVKISVIQPDGKKVETSIPLVKLLTLTSSIKL